MSDMHYNNENCVYNDIHSHFTWFSGFVILSVTTRVSYRIICWRGEIWCTLAHVFLAYCALSALSTPSYFYVLKWKSEVEVSQKSYPLP